MEGSIVRRLGNEQLSPLGEQPPHFGRQATEANPLRAYWHVLLKRKWLIVFCFVVFTSLATITTMRMTPIYEASATIAIFRENVDAVGTGPETLAAQEDWDYNVALETQVGILKSQQLALKVAQALKIGDEGLPAVSQTSDPSQSAIRQAIRNEQLAGTIRGGLKVQVLPRTRLVQLTYASPDPVLAARVVNTLTEIYKEENFRAKYEAAVQTTEWLTKQLVDLQLKMESSQAALVRYQRESNIVGLDEKQNIVTVKLEDLNQQLTAAENDRIQKEALYRMAQGGSPELYSSNEQAELFKRLRQRRSELQGQRAELSVTFGPAYPKIAAIDSQMKEVDDSLKTEQQKLLAKIKGDYDTAMQRERMLRASLERQRVEANDLAQNAIHYNLLKREADGSRELYDNLLRRSKESAINASLRSANIRTIDVAQVPVAPARPNIPRNIFLGMLLGMVAGVVSAFVRELMENTVRVPEEVEFISGLSMLGMVPLTRSLETADTGASRFNPRNVFGKSSEKRNTALALASHRRPKSEMAEAFRAIRTSLLLSEAGQLPKVILFTSPLPQEGKSTISVNAAIVLAQRGAKVLLVDTDLRRPSVHRAFDLPKPELGLSGVLSGTTSVEAAIQPSPILPNLHVLSAGKVPSQPAELLDSEKMRTLLADWREQYDHVVIDTPPVLSVTDAVILSQLADSVVIVVKSGKTTKQALRRTREMLAHVNARVVGVVINGFDSRSAEAYYYYGYSYGYGYGDSKRSKYFDE